MISADGGDEGSGDADGGDGGNDDLEALHDKDKSDDKDKSAAALNTDNPPAPMG